MWTYRLARPALVFLGLEMSLYLLVFGLPYLLGSRAWVTEVLVRPEYRRADVAAVVTGDLIASLSTAGLRAWLCGAICALAWLAAMAFHRPAGPGQAGRLVRWWVALMIAAVLATLFSLYEMVVWEGRFLEMQPDKMNVLATSLVLLCWASFHPFGTFASTPRLHRPAVPFAALLTRG